MAGGEWFSRARFGMMIHWGLYALLAGEYGGERMGGADNGDGELGEWAQTYFRIPNAEYEKLAGAFNPLGFSAEEWVRLAKDAGMNYIVITSKHHDGFALFKSEADTYNVVDATPFGRDVIGELAEACRKYDMKLGLYYSQELDWHEPDGGGYESGYKNVRSCWTNNWDFPDNAKKDFSRCFDTKIKPQVKEILTKYGDICVIWFDTPGVITPGQSDELYAMVKEYQPDCLVNSRIGNGRGDYESLGDNQVPGGRKADGGLYETAATLNDTWGYKAYDQNWKNAEEVISLLTRLASRNVNYLLNVGPDHLGRIPAVAQRILRQVGQWTRLNGEAVYGAQPSPYGVELPSGPVTASGDHLYFVLDFPSDTLEIPGVLSRVEKACVLGVGDVEFEQSGTDVKLALPDLRGTIRPVARISAQGGVKVDGGIIELPGGIFTLTPARAKITGHICVGSASDMRAWRDEGALEWTFNAAEEGEYMAEMTVNGLHGIEPVKAEIILEVNGENIKKQLQHDRDIDPLIARHHKGMISDVGRVKLRAGENRVTLRLARKVEEDMFRFAALHLTRM